MAIALTILFIFVYGFMQTTSIYAGDSGGLVAAAYTWGIAHPPGYPLYCLLGAFFSHTLPWGTIPWRMGFLSSVPMALSIYFLWTSIYRLTISKLASSVGAVAFGFLYPVWLYAMVPEVFGLYALFSSLILYLFLSWIQTKNGIWLLILAFVSGLSLTHHHLILVLLFSCAVTILWKYPLLVKQAKGQWRKLLGFFILGWCAYLYAPIVSSLHPPFDWEHPANPVGFFRLVTRASYGTFRASIGSGDSFMDRWLNVFTFFHYCWNDWGVMGIVGVITGFVVLWKKMRRIFTFFVIYTGFLMFYFFYAGFVLNSDFAIGTLERFFIIPYQTAAVLFGVGLAGILDAIGIYWKKNQRTVHVPFWVIIVFIIGIAGLWCIRSVRMNYQRLHPLTDDRTLENLADDILLGVPEKSILSLSDDTSIYAMDYAYFVQKKRQDICFLQFPMLSFDDYRVSIKKRCPSIQVPQRRADISIVSYVAEFIQENAKQSPVLDDRLNTVIPEFWIPRGLVVMYTPTLDSLPDRKLILDKNQELWNQFHDPKNGALSSYQHLMLSDVLRYFAAKRLTLAQSYLSYGDMAGAEKEMAHALSYNPDRPELAVPYYLMLLDKKDCGPVKSYLQQFGQKLFSFSSVMDVFYAFLKTCPDDTNGLEDLKLQFDAIREKSAIRL